MNIAILGATSQIAQDLILSFSENTNYKLSLFGRNTSSDGQRQIQLYSDFNKNQNYDVIINFVGVGDPVKAQKMGSDIFKITEKYDNLALDYLKQNSKTKYIFLSSGAVYGGNYQKPVDKDTVATIDINNLKPTDWYTLAKLYAEAKHRSLSNLSIVDVRVFNYFSHTQDMNARFLITDIVRAINNNEIFKTSRNDTTRDFITPFDFYNLIQVIINYDSVNIALDCYTKSPISKIDLLTTLKKKFGLSYVFDLNTDIINATGEKINYYSKNKSASKIGYRPKYSSIDAIVKEISFIYKQDK